MTMLAQILKLSSNACEVVGSVALLEMKNVPPAEALLCLTSGAGGLTRTSSDLEKPFKDFMTYFVTLVNGKSPLTGSCGQTSGWLAAITAKDGQEGALTDKPTTEIIAELKTVNVARWYCRFTTGSHSFLIEHADDKYCVYQSFHGAESIQASVTNILDGKFVFTDKSKFFEKLELALLDAADYIKVKTQEAEDTAISAATKHGGLLSKSRLKELSEALVMLDVFSTNARALKVKSEAKPWEWTVVQAFNEALDPINENAMASGKAQDAVFHNKQWKTQSPSKYRLNTDPASPDKVAENIVVRSQANLAAWNKCFQDTKSPMKAQLDALGIKI